MEDRVRDFLRDHKGYLKTSNIKIAKRLDLFPITKDTLEVVGKIKKKLRNRSVKEFTTVYQVNQELRDTFSVPVQHYMDDPRNLEPVELFNKRVMVIGDLHAPFIKKGYLEHCKNMYDKYECDTVVFIGDVVDNHYPSYHETDANGMGGATELQTAINSIRTWAKVFPEAYVTIGNHDRLIMRRAQTSNVPRQWIRTYKEVLETPGWVFLETLTIDDINYNHGEGSTARTKAKNNLESTVQGHLHSQAYIEYFVGRKRKIFAMQVGCGIEDNAYSMAYGKNHKKSVISAAVVIHGTPYLELMEL